MIAQNQNILEDSTIKRTVEYNEDDKQITFLDSRYYQRNGEFYPSVTYVLGYIPKGKYFIDWIKEKGEDADKIRDEAALRGKQVHGAIEKLVKGEELNWIAPDGSANYSLEVWGMLLNFKDFWDTHKPKLIGTETHVFSDKYKVAGTIDLIVEMFDSTWIIDIKTTRSLAKIYNYQVAAYRQCFMECFDRKVDRSGLLWLNSSTRKPDASGKKIRGKGWSLVESENSFETDLKSFELAYAMYKHEAEYHKPLSYVYDTTIKLSIVI